MKSKKQILVLFLLFYIIDVNWCLSNQITENTLFQFSSEKLAKEVTKIDSFLKSIEEEEKKIKNFIGNDKLSKQELPTFKEEDSKLTEFEKDKFERELINNLSWDYKKDRSYFKSIDDERLGFNNRREQNEMESENSINIKKNEDWKELEENFQIFRGRNRLYQLVGSKLRINTQLLTLEEKKVLTE